MILLRITKFIDNAVVPANDGIQRLPSHDAGVPLAGRVGACKHRPVRRRMACHSKPLLHRSQERESCWFVSCTFVNQNSRSPYELFEGFINQN
jgi:hypothetical protein